MKTCLTSKGAESDIASVRSRTAEKDPHEATERSLSLRACQIRYTQADGDSVGIFALPSEIFSEVSLFINFKTATSLAHTCKAMQQIIYPYMNSIALRDIESKDPTLFSLTSAATLQRYKTLATLTQRTQRYESINGRYRLSLLSWIYFRHTECAIRAHLGDLFKIVTELKVNLDNIGPGNISQDARAEMRTVCDNIPTRMKQRINQWRDITFNHVEQMCSHVPGDFEREEF